MNEGLDYQAMLAVALEEAKLGRAEGGIPIGAALFGQDGVLLGKGHNRRVQENDPSIHGETDAFRKAGRPRTFCGGINWLRERGVEVIDLDSSDCMSLLTAFIEAHPAVWHEDIGEE